VRLLTRLVSAVLAIVLLVGGVAVAVEILVAAIGREQPLWLPWDEWRRTGVETPWSDPVTRTVLIAVVAVGFLLLFLLFAPRRARAVPLAHRVAGAEADLDRGGLERWLEGRMARVDGVAAATVRVRRGAARVRASTPARETADVRERVRAAASAALGELDLASALPVRVAVDSAREVQP